MARRVAETTVSALVCALALAGCGGSESGPAAESGGEYPLVTLEEPHYQPPVTSPNGSVSQAPVVPTEHEREPSPTCERMLATYHDGSIPTKRPVIVPPTPGLRAHAITPRRIRLEWWFDALPADCRPVSVLLGVTTTGSTPTNAFADVTATSGSTEIEYPDFLPVPETAIASSFTHEGHRSRTVKVKIVP
jgi:hypothetical protein